MVERKRRNDFVRKREFDMLRKVRREGLSPEQLATLGSSSRLDDSEARQSESASARPEGGVKAKIDEIEQQMVGGSFSPVRAAQLGLLQRARPNRRCWRARACRRRPRGVPLVAAARGAAGPAAAARPGHRAGGARAGAGVQRAWPAAAGTAVAGHHAATPANSSTASASRSARWCTTRTWTKPVIAFANADFASANSRCRSSPVPGGARSQHAETWLVLFDLYRATGQQQRFEALAGDYAHQFGWSAPQWFSLPKLVSDAVADAANAERGSGSAAQRRGRLDLPGAAGHRRRGAAALADAADAAALGLRLGGAAQHRCRSGDAAVVAVPPLEQAAAGDALDVGREPVRHAAGGRADRRARCRPGVLAGAAGCAAPGQPGRPVRRGGHRLLRDLRGVAAVVGAHALQRAHQRLRH